MRQVDGPEEHKEIKDISMIKGVPYCFHKGLGKVLRLNSIHFVWFTKYMIPLFMYPKA